MVANRRQVGILNGPGSDPERLNALNSVVHLVADVRQPAALGKGTTDR